jgi:hypothetical protein
MERSLLQTKSFTEFKAHVKEHMVPVKDTYARREEKLVFSNVDLSEYIDSAFSCDYRLGGV